jgi:hypothetical protein
MRLFQFIVLLLALVFQGKAQHDLRDPGFVTLLSLPASTNAPAAWRPSDEGTNCFFWFSGGSNAALSGANITFITNIVGTNVWTAVSDPAQTNLGSRIGIICDSGDYFDFANIFNISSNTPLTFVFTVANYQASGATFNTMWSYGPSVANQRFQLGTPANSSNMAFRAASPMNSVPTQPILSSTTNVLSWAWAGTGTATNGLWSYLNGGSASTYLGGPSQWAAPQTGRINNYTGGSQSPTAITYGEFMVFYGTNTVIRQKAEGYAAWANGSQDMLDAGHPYKTGPP